MHNNNVDYRWIPINSNLARAEVTGSLGKLYEQSN